MSSEAESQKQLEVIESLCRIKPDPCEYVPLRNLKKLSSLTPGQKSFYAYWKANLEEGRNIGADEGYVWLWMTETATVKTDLEKTEHALKAIEKEYLERIPQLSIFRLTWYAEQGLLQPIKVNMNETDMANLLMMAPMPMPEEFFTAIFVDGGVYPRHEEALAFSRTIALIDRELRQDGGIGLIERMTYTKTIGIDKYDYLPVHRNGMIAYEYRTLIGSTTTRFILKELLESVMNMMRGDDVLPGFEMFRGAIRKAIEGGATDPVPLLVKVCDLHETNGRGVRRPAFVLSPPYSFTKKALSDFLESLCECDDDGGDAEYVPSLGSKGIILSPAVKSYYLRWKRNWQNGTVMDIDRGYLSMYLGELKTEGFDKSRFSDELRALWDAYGSLMAVGAEVMNMATSGECILSIADAYPRGNSFDLFMNDMATKNAYGLSMSDIRSNIATTPLSYIFIDEDCVSIFRRCIVYINEVLDVDYGCRYPDLCDQSVAVFYGDLPMYFYEMVGLRVKRYSDSDCVWRMSTILDAIVRRVLERKGTAVTCITEEEEIAEYIPLVESCIRKHFLSEGDVFENLHYYDYAHLDFEESQKILDAVPVEPCRFVACGDRNIIPEMMTESQKRYYVYWRSRLVEGECLEAEAGYLHCRIGELLQSDEDMQSKKMQLDLMAGRYPELSMLFETSESYIRWVSGYPSDRIFNYSDDLYFDLAFNDVFSDPPVRIRSIDLTMLFRHLEVSLMPGGDDSPCSLGEWTETFNRMMAALSKVLMSRYGMGIPQFVSRGFSIKELEFSIGCAYDLGVYAEVWMHRIEIGRLISLVRSIASCCNKVIGVKGAKLSYNDVLTRRIVDDVLSEYSNVGPEDFRPEGLTERGGLPERTMSSACSCNMKMTNAKPSDRYVGSDEGRPTDVSAYYNWWKVEVDAGRYPFTDKGYIDAYIRDMTSKNAEPSAVLAKMDEFRAAYDPLDRGREIYNDMFLYAVSKKIALPDSGYNADHPGAYVVLWQIVSGKGGRLTREGIKTISGISKTSEGNLADEGVDAINRCIGASAAKLKNKVTAFRTLYGIRIKRARLYYPMARGEVTYNEIDGTKNLFSEAIRDLVSDIAAMSKKRAYEPYAFGNLSSKEVSDLIKGNEKPADVRKIKLNKGAIKSAEVDLRNVTEMMRTEDAVEDVPEAEVVEPQNAVVDADDPWSSFVSALTEDESELLSAILCGKGAKGILTRMGLTMVKAEDAINGKSLDHVGDTVMEGGVIVEEYLDDLKEALSSSGRTE